MSAPLYKNVGPNLYVLVGRGTYYALIGKSGKQIRRSLHTTDRAVAEVELGKLRARLASGLPEPKRFRDVAAAWMAARTHRIKPSSQRKFAVVIGQLNRFFGNELMHRIAQGHWNDYQSRRGDRLAPNTFNKDLSVFRGIWELARVRGWVDGNAAVPLRPRKQDRKRPQPPTREQYELLLSTIRTRMDCRAWESAVLVELMATTGMRRCEAAAFRWEDVDWGRGVFRVTGGSNGTKNGDVCVAPIFPALRALLERLGKTRRQEGKVTRIDNPKRVLSRACKLAGLPHFTSHSFRHFFCTNAIQSGVDMPTVAAWLNHKDGGMLVARTYNHLRQEHSMRMAQKMAEPYGLPPPLEGWKA